MAPKVAIIYYTTYGHTYQLAKEIQKGVYDAGLTVDLFRVADGKLSPEENGIPEATTEVFEDYDAFLFGLPSKFGNFSGEWKNLFDSTGSLWNKGSLVGKPAGLFVCTGTIGGGQESTIISAISVLVHHGMIFVPLGYKNATQHTKSSFVVSKQASEEIHGGSPWGSGVYSGVDGNREPSNTELKIAKLQGKTFAEVIRKF